MKSKDKTIWRYIDLAKYIDMLSTKELFFTRSDCFDDPFEGSVTKVHYKRRTQEIQQVVKNFEKEFEMYQLMGEVYRKFVFINCWHMNESESAALWKLYLQSAYGVVIKSTRKKLMGALITTDFDLWSIPVKYIDYDIDDPPFPTEMAPFRYKRKSFEHERELRAIIYTDIITEEGKLITPRMENGIKILCDLNALITHIYIAPTSPDWFEKLVIDVTKKYGYNFPVKSSEIATKSPLFVA